MTTMSFALSGAPADALRQRVNWTAPVARLTWSGAIHAEWVDGVAPVPLQGGQSDDGDLTLGNYNTSGYYELDNVLIPCGKQELGVAVQSCLDDQMSWPVYTSQSVTLSSAWNSIKDIEISSISAQVLDVIGFVDNLINVAGDNNDHQVGIEDAKRGSVAMGNGNDIVDISVAANEYTWPSHFDIVLGNGRDSVFVTPASDESLSSLSAPPGWTFNSAPQLTTAAVTLGNGNDDVGLMEVSGTIHVGSGNDMIQVTNGDTTTWLGSGTDQMNIGSRYLNGYPPGPWAHDTQVGASTVHVGSGHVSILVDDTDPALTPKTTLIFMRGETGGSTLASADQVSCGHFDAGNPAFLLGGLDAVTFDFIGYSAGSTATLRAAPSSLSTMLLDIHDTATGGMDAVVLDSTMVTSVSALHIRFG